MDKTTQRLMPGIAAIPSQKWIVQHTTNIAVPAYSGYYGNSAFALLSTSDTTSLVMLGTPGGSIKYTILDSYGNISYSKDMGNSSDIMYYWPVTPGQAYSTNYYTTRASISFNSTLSFIVSRSIVDNYLDTTSSYALDQVYQNSTYTWGLGYRYVNSTLKFNLAVAMFNSSNVTQWIRVITPASGYDDFGGITLCPVSSDMEMVAYMSDSTGTLQNKTFTAKIAQASGIVSYQRLIGDSVFDLKPIDMVADLTYKYILIGNENQQTYLVKINYLGVLQWQKEIVNNDTAWVPDLTAETGGKIAIDSGGNTYVVQRSMLQLDTCFITLTKINSLGNIVFSNNISIPSGSTLKSDAVSIAISGTSVTICATYYDSSIDPTNFVTCLIKFFTTDTTLPLGTYDMVGYPSLYIANSTEVSVATSSLSVTSVTYTTSSVSTTYVSKVDSDESINYATSTVVPILSKVQLT